MRKTKFQVLIHTVRFRGKAVDKFDTCQFLYFKNLCFQVSINLGDTITVNIYNFHTLVNL